MKNLFVILFLSLICLTACSQKQTVADSLIDASDAISQQDFTTAASICRGVIDKHPINTLSASELCQISVMLIKISEHVDAEDNMAAALKCYSHVMAAKTDSANRYFNALPSEDFQYVSILNNLNTSLTAASDTASFPEE